MKEVTYKGTANYNGKKFVKQTGLSLYQRTTMEIGSDEKVISIEPLNSRGIGAIMMEVPVSDIGAFVEAIGSQLPRETEGSGYSEWLKDVSKASPFDNQLFYMFFYASDENAFRLLAAFPEKFISPLK